MSKLPVFFISHGAPTFALEPGITGPLLTKAAAKIQKPKAVLVLSPHWMTQGLQVSTNSKPQTIHDFGGFPRPLYDLQYPAKGATDTANRTLELLREAGYSAKPEPRMGLDHGAWVVMRCLYPKADVPVFQVSIPQDLTPAQAIELGKTLSPLSDEGVLIVASGALTHNLGEFSGGERTEEPYVKAFVGWVRDALKRKDSDALAQIMTLAPHARRAHPSIDHLLPLNLAFGAASKDAELEIIKGGTRYGMLSMESYLFAA